MDSDARRAAAKHHLALAELYADDGSLQFAADHADRAAKLLQPAPGDDTA